MNRYRRNAIGWLLVAVLAATVLSARPAQAATVPERVAGANDVESSVALSQRVFPGGADVVLLASVESLAVVRTAGGLRGGPILIVPACGDAPSSITDEVERLDPDRVIALGDEGELCSALAGTVAAGRTVTRLPGPVSAPGDPLGRQVFDTAVAIAERRFPEGAGTVYLAGGEDVGAAAAGGMLVDGPTLVVDSTTTSTFELGLAVDRLGPERVVALGDAAAVPDGVLSAVADGRPTERIGAEGSVAVAVTQRRFGLDEGRLPVDAVYLAVSGAVGLRSAGTISGDSPVLPVPAACGALTGEMEAELQRLRPRSVVALGGEEGVCAAQLERAAAAATVTPAAAAAARVLSEEERAALSSATETALRFAAPPASLADVQVGSVVISEPATAAPEGLLRRVTSISQDGGALVLQTQQAAIGEAIADGVGGAQVTVTPEQVAAASLPKGVTVLPQAAGQGSAPLPITSLTIDLDRVIHDVDGDPATVEDRVVADGTLELALEVDTALDVRRFTVERFKFAVQMREQLDVGYTVGSAVSGDWEHEVASIPLKPITFPVAGVPVVVVPEIRVSVGASTGATVAVEFSGEQTLSAVVGAEYTDDAGWRDVSGLTHDADGSAAVPSSGATADRAGSVRRTVAAELFGVAGPNVFVASHLELGSRDGGTPDHQLLLRNNAGVAVAVNLPFIGTVAEYQQVLFDRSEELWRHPTDPPPLLSDTGGDLADPRYDILEHRADFYDTLDLAVRVADPRPMSEWSPDDAIEWRVDGAAQDYTADYYVVLEQTEYGPSIFVMTGSTSIACRLENGGISYSFDGTWHRLSISPDCLIVWVGGPYEQPTSVQIGVETYRFADSAAGDYTRLDHDTAPNGWWTDPSQLAGPISRGESWGLQRDQWYRYMSRGELGDLQQHGRLRYGRTEGLTFLTRDSYDSVAEAQAKLALPFPPEVGVLVTIPEPLNRVIGPEAVQDDFGQPGGGTQWRIEEPSPQARYVEHWALTGSPSEAPMSSVEDGFTPSRSSGRGTPVSCSRPTSRLMNFLSCPTT